MKIAKISILALATALSGCVYLPAKEEPAPAPAAAPVAKKAAPAPAPATQQKPTALQNLDFDPFADQGGGDGGGGSW